MKAGTQKREQPRTPLQSRALPLGRLELEEVAVGRGGDRQVTSLGHGSRWGDRAVLELRVSPLPHLAAGATAETLLGSALLRIKV